MKNILQSDFEEFEEHFAQMQLVLWIKNADWRNVKLIMKESDH